MLNVLKKTSWNDENNQNDSFGTSSGMLVEIDIKFRNLGTVVVIKTAILIIFIIDLHF